MIGQVISHYKITEKLGEGGMGVIYKAHDARLDRTVALKFLPSHIYTGDVERERFLQEARAAAALNHPNVCTVFDIGEHDGLPYIVMEYLDGETLRHKIRQKLPSLKESLEYAIQIGEALKAAHEKEIVHRDIKSENIMITTQGQIKVMDFGLAKLKGSLKLTKTSSTIGTLAYMAPEQIQGEEVDARSDIFSFGVVLFEMVTGQMPFHGEYDSAMMYAILNDEPQSPQTFRSEIPEKLSDIISKALEKDPDLRYQVVKGILADLKRLKRDSGRVLRTAAVEVPQPPEEIATTEVASEEKPLPSIAVLPFVNMSADPEQEYFCDGMAEEIINALTHVRDLHIVARTSAFFFKGKDVDIEEIGRKLHVETILEGSVRKAGNRLRITAQLVNVADGYHLWSERYDRQLEDVFEIQDEISMAIVEKLKVELLGEQQDGLVRQPTENMEAYALYLKGRFFLNKLSPADTYKAVSCYQQAIDLDPGFALAYTGLAITYVVMGPSVGLTLISPEEAYPQAQAAVMKALALDDRLAAAHAVQGIIHVVFEWDWSGAYSAFCRALDLNQNDSDVHLWYSWYLLAICHFDESLEAARHAEDLDPLSLSCKTRTASIYMYLGRNDEQIAQLEQILEMDPHYYLALHLLGWANLLKDMNDLSNKYFQRMLDLVGREPVVLLNFAVLSAHMGKRNEAHQYMEELKALSEKRYVSPTYFAYIYFFLKDQEEAFHNMDRAYEERDPNLIYFLLFRRPTAPEEAITWHDTFYSHPRVQAIKKKVWPEKK